MIVRSCPVTLSFCLNGIGNLLSLSKPWKLSLLYYDLRISITPLTVVSPVSGSVNFAVRSHRRGKREVTVTALKSKQGWLFHLNWRRHRMGPGESEMGGPELVARIVNAGPFPFLVERPLH